jgi:hypothetical protein
MRATAARRVTLTAVKRLAVLLAVLAVPAVAAAATSPFGAGYRTTVKGQVPALNGAWRITFTAKGNYGVTKPPSSTRLISGKATVKGNTMTFRDSGGPLACNGGTAGSYVWTLKGKTLTLKILKDTCPGRPLILGAAPFTRTG